MILRDLKVESDDLKDLWLEIEEYGRYKEYYLHIIF